MCDFEGMNKFANYRDYLDWNDQRSKFIIGAIGSTYIPASGSFILEGPIQEIRDLDNPETAKVMIHGHWIDVFWHNRSKYSTVEATEVQNVVIGFDPNKHYHGDNKIGYFVHKKYEGYK